MLKRIFTAALLVLLMGSGIAFLPQKPLKEQLIKALALFHDHFFQEKVYLQLDKDYYAAGRTIWYKAYIMLQRQPTELSSILYVELLDKKGKVLQRNKRPINDGGAYGNFKLPTDLPAGDYRIRAYTMWMRNFDPAFFFSKDIHVYRPLVKEEKLPPAPDTASGDFSVQFFPEGGDLVDSINSVVAFKAINAKGYPAKVRGVIRDREGNVIDSIQSVHDGMGSFSFMPLPGQTYTADMTDSSGMTKTFTLPAAQSFGVTLHLVKVNNEKVFFQVQRRVSGASDKGLYKLAAQIHGQLIYFAGIDFSQGYTGGLIPIKSDPAGIMQVTLFSTEGIPLAERLVFLKNETVRLPLQLSTDTVSLKPRGKNVYTLHLPDSVQGNFSVAVTDADQVLQSPDQNNIISHYLLTSDIKGHVYNPAWYFQADDSATRRGLELVMLTNGWRRFEWRKILNNQYPDIKFAPEPNGLHFLGKIYTKKGPVTTGSVSMMLRSPIDSTTYFISGAAEPTGYFKIDHLSFLDTAYLYYKAMDTLHKRKPVEVEFAEAPEPEYRLLNNRILPGELPVSDRLQNYLELAGQRNQRDQYISNRTILLNEVTITANRIPKEETTEERYTSGMFKSDNGYTFDLTDKTLPYTNILQFLMGRVPGLMIGPNPASPSVRWRGGTPGFFLDEIPVSVEEIMNVPVDDIALVKVYRPPFMGGFGGADGAIAIYTRRGGDRNFDPGAGFLKKPLVGYTIVRQFYSPDYSVDKKVNELADNRATLYWDPLLKTDSTTHDLKISFYNSDITKRLRIIVEGITSNGKIARIEKLVE